MNTEYNPRESFEKEKCNKCNFFVAKGNELPYCRKQISETFYCYIEHIEEQNKQMLEALIIGIRVICKTCTTYREICEEKKCLQYVIMRSAIESITGKKIEEVMK